jgi:hypothetical protein
MDTVINLHLDDDPDGPDWIDRYHHLMERAWAHLDDGTDASLFIAWMRYAGEIREGLAVDLLRPLVRLVPPPMACKKCHGDHHEDNHDEATLGLGARLQQAGHEAAQTVVYRTCVPSLPPHVPGSVRACECLARFRPAIIAPVMPDDDPAPARDDDGAFTCCGGKSGHYNSCEAAPLAPIVPIVPGPADTVWTGPADHPGRGGLPLAYGPTGDGDADLATLAAVVEAQQEHADPCADGRCVDPVAHAEGAHDR